MVSENRLVRVYHLGPRYEPAYRACAKPDGRPVPFGADGIDDAPVGHVRLSGRRVPYAPPQMNRATSMSSTVSRASWITCSRFMKMGPEISLCVSSEAGVATDEILSLDHETGELGRSERGGFLSFVARTGLRIAS